MKKRKNGNNIILEEMRSQFKVFGEALSDIRTKGDATFEVVGKMQEDFTVMKEDVAVLKEDVAVLKEDVAVLKEDVGVLKEDVGVLKEDVGILKKDMRHVKGEITMIRGDLKEKADRSEVAALDGRVITLENAAKA